MNLQCAISDTAVTSAAVPVMKHSEKPSQFVRHDAALDHLDAAPLGQLDRGPPRDAVEEAIGDRRMDLAVLDEEDVGAGALGHAALPVQHHGVGIAFLSAPCF